MAGPSRHLSSFLDQCASVSKNPSRLSVSDPRRPQLRSGWAWSPDHHLGDSSYYAEIALAHVVKERDRERGDRTAISYSRRETSGRN